ncbi:MAG: hypothetical protein IJF19_01360 [Clostridia bacterium]|nr:hypothetical protein [Clostridia bacterium]
MKKLVAIILALLVLIFAFAGCDGKGEAFTPPSLSADNTAVSTQEADTKETPAVTDTVDESKNDGNAQGENAPSLEDDDLEIITYVPTQDPQPEGGNYTPHTNTQPPATESNTEDSEEETTERDAIILPFVPAE